MPTLNTLTLASSAESVTPVGGATSVTVNTLTLAGSAESIAMAPGQRTLIMDTLVLDASIVTISPSMSVQAATLTLASSAPSLTVSGGATSTVMSTLTLASSAERVTVNRDFLGTVELAQLRAENHEIEIYGSPLVPQTLWTAQINNGSIGRGDTTIVFDNGSGSNFGLIEAVQEVWVGTSSGKKDIGRLRIRSISSGDGGVTGTLTAARHPWILVDGAWLTFKFDYPLRPPPPLLEGDGTFKKDINIPYSDQNLKPSPVVVAGTHRADFLGTGGSTVFDVDASQSYAIADGASISSYALTMMPAAGVTVNFNTSTGKGDLTFTTTGQWWAKYTVTDSNGKSQVSYRCYFIHSTDVNDPDYPLLSFYNFRMSGSWSRGGWDATFSIYEDATTVDIPDETLIVVWAKTKFDDTEAVISLLPDDSTTWLAGYLVRSNSNTDLESGFQKSDFDIVTVQEMLRRFNFSVSLEVVEGTPGTWYEYADWLTVGRAVHHLWKWHSTLFEITDVLGLMRETADILRPYAEFEEADLYTMADGISNQHGIRHHVVCDKGGRVHLVPDLQLLTDLERSQRSKVFEITMDDRRGNIGLDAKNINRVAFVKTSGFWWNGSFKTDERNKRVPDAQPICSSAPGVFPDDEGPGVLVIDRQTFRDQAHCDQIAARLFAQQNNRYPVVPVTFQGNYVGVVDVATDHWYTTSLQATDTARGEVLTDFKMACRSASVQYNGNEGTILLQAQFEGEQDAVVGVPGYCLDNIPSVGGYPTPPPEELPDALMTGSSAYFKDAAGKAWALRNAQTFLDLEEDPFWPSKQFSIASNNAIVWASGDGFIWRSDDAMQSAPIDITPVINPPNTEGDTPAPTATDLLYSRVEGNWMYSDEWSAITSWQNTSNEWRSWIGYSDDDGQVWSWTFVGSGLNSIESISAGVDITEDWPTDDPFHFQHGWEASQYHIARLTATKFVVGYHNIDYTVRYRIVNVGGSIGDYETAGVNGVETSDFAITELTSNTFFIIFEDYVSGSPGSFHTYIRVGQESSGVITFGSAVEITDMVNGIYWDRHVAKIDSTHVLITYGNSIIKSDPDGVSEARVASITGLTPTLYNAAQFTEDQVTQCHSVVLSSSQIVTIWNEYNAGGVSGDREVKARVGDLVGTTITYGSIPENVLLTDDSNHPKYLHSRRLSATKFLMAYQRTEIDDDAYVAVCSVDADNYLVSIGTPANYTDNIYTYTYMDTLGTNRAIVAYDDKTVWGWYAKVVRISDTSITLSSAEYFHEDDDVWPLVRQAGGDSAFVAFETDDTVSGDGYIRYAMVTLSGTGGEAKLLGLSIGKGDGDKLYVTLWEPDQLVLAVYSLPDHTLLDWIPLGSATLTQINSRQRWAIPYAGIGDDDWIVVYGRMAYPAGQAESPAHVIESTDGGIFWTTIESDWGDDHCGALVMEADGFISAIRNQGVRAKLYRGYDFDSLSLMSTLDLEANVNEMAMRVDVYSGAVYAGSSEGNPVMVVKSEPPYSNWINMTYDHGTTDGIVSILLL